MSDALTDEIRALRVRDAETEEKTRGSVIGANAITCGQTHVRRRGDFNGGPTSWTMYARRRRTP
jgi:hypothetical protein